jgi:hypothetical protein
MDGQAEDEQNSTAVMLLTVGANGGKCSCTLINRKDIIQDRIK